MVMLQNSLKLRPLAATVLRTLAGNTRRRLLLVGLLYGLVAFAEYNLFHRVDSTTVGPLILVPVVAAGVLLGFRAGIIAGIVGFFVNTAVYSLALEPSLDVVIENGGTLGSLAVVFVGATLGRMHDLYAERSDLIETLRHRNDELNATFAALPDMLFVLDREGFILEYRAGKRSDLYREPDQLMGKHYSESLPPDVSLEIDRHFPRVGREGETVSFEYQLDTSSDLQWFEARMVRGQDNRIITIVQNVTERKQHELERFNMMAEREQIRVLSEFIHNVSHDVRTPLSSLRTSLYLMKKTRGQDTSSFTRHAEMMESQVKRLTKLIDGMLLMARLDTSGKLTTKLINPNDLVGFTLREIDFLARKREVEIETQLAGTLPDIPIDENHIGQALFNLAENAIQYSPVGGKVILRTREEGGAVVIEVEDFGEGIPEHELDLVFERFYRVAKHRPVDKGASGLGLPYARKVVERHGGSVEIVSEVGQGTTVTARLPIGKVVSEAFIAS